MLLSTTRVGWPSLFRWTRDGCLPDSFVWRTLIGRSIFDARVDRSNFSTTSVHWPITFHGRSMATFFDNAGTGRLSCSTRVDMIGPVSRRALIGRAFSPRVLLVGRFRQGR